MATTVWFIPGFMGSTLGVYPASGGVRTSGNKVYSIWGNLQSIPGLPAIQQLALPSTLPPTLVIVADGVAPSVLGGYSDFLKNLATIMPAGWVLAPWPYDWRLSARTLGQQLATALAANLAAGNTNIVVGHSYGALVAWLAWANLVDLANTAAMSRLITFGGALYGASATPGIFLENETSLNNLILLQSFFIGGLGGGLFQAITGPSDPQVQGLLNLTATWPAVYDLYPDQGLNDDPGDTNRPLLFSSSYWGAALSQPNFTLLSAEVAAVHQYVRQAKYVPPANMSANIVSAAINTPYRVQPSQASALLPGNPTVPPQFNPNSTQGRRWQLPSFSNTVVGDGRVTVNQASWPGHYISTVSSPHAAMQDDPNVLVAVLALMTATFPTPPPPSPQTQQAPFVPPTAQSLLTFQQRQLLLLEAIYAPAVNGVPNQQPYTGAPTPIPRPRVGVDP